MIVLLAIVGLFLLPMPWAAVGIVVALAVEVAEYWGWVWFLRRYRVQTGVEAMPGTVGEVVVACDPEGRVRVRGELWWARSSEPLERGARVVVRGVDGLTLEVEPR